MISQQNGNKPLDLRYRIKGNVKPMIKLERTINDSTVIAEPLKNPSQEDTQTTPTSKKKVCNENGSNIMTSEEIKHKPVKVPTNNGVIPGELTIAPIKQPNGKIKGRKRKHLNYSDIVIESKDDIKNLAKRLKLEKSTGSNNNKKLQSESFSSLAQLEIISSNNNEKTRPLKDVKEVQLQISENGVMSARSISCNGDDKVVYDLSKRVVSSSTTASTSTSPTTSQNISLTEKLLLSGNFHSKTGPTGLTEIICDKPAPSSSSMKQTTPKPGYVTLNIPTPKNPLNGRVSSFTNDVGNKRFASDLNGCPSTGEKNQLKSNTNDKLKQKAGTKEKDINGLTDLKKVCTGTSIEATDMMEMQRNPGKHSLPIVAPMSNPFHQQRSKISNGAPLKSSTDTYVLPAALNFSPASGMSVSMIPCTTSGGTNGTNTMDGAKSLNSLPYRNNNTPPKRPSHQSSLTNGEIKIRPKPILPKLNGDHQEISPKKPPKFFKSRRTSSPVSPFNGKNNTSMSPKHDNNESKRKTPVPMINVGCGEPTPKKANKERKDQQNETSLPDATAINFLNLLNAGVLAANAAQTSSPSGMPNVSSSNGLHALRQLAHSPQVNEKYSQQVTALNNFATMQNATDPLNSGLGIAAVAAAAAAAASNNGNGLPLGMTPFVTDNYCSLPFLNQRQPMAMSAQFPFAFNFPGMGYTGTTFLTTATTTPVNSTKTKSSPLPTGDRPFGILNDLLSTPSSAKVMSNDSASTLDLSVAKSSAQENTSHGKSTDSNPLLVSLLNSTSKIKSPPSKQEDSGKIVSPDAKRHADSTVKIPDKSKSPLIRQLLQKREEKEKASASSPERKNPCVTTSNIKPDGLRDNKSDNDNRKSPVNDPNSPKLNGNGINGATGNGSPVKPESNTTNDGNAVNSESKLSVPANGCSPTIKNDTHTNNESTKVALDAAKLLCLSAQNNNNTLSNNHDKSNGNSKPNGNGLDDKDNGTSDNNVPSTGTQLIS